MSTRIEDLPDDVYEEEPIIEIPKTVLTQKLKDYTEDAPDSTKDNFQFKFDFKSEVILIVLFVILSFEPVQTFLRNTFSTVPYGFVAQGVVLYIVYLLTTKYGKYLTDLISI